MHAPGSVIAVLFAALSCVAAACSPGATTADAGAAAGLLIRNVQIVDGTGAARRHGDVRIVGNTIADVGELEPRANETVYDGQGLVLTPGFIDTHSHADSDILDQPDAIPAVSQGITTVVVGQDGGSPYPLADFLAKFRATPAAINLATYVGHNTLRSEVMGKDFRRKATAEEVAAMAKLLQQELATGALGLSTGLEYDPGHYSDPAEVLALAQVAADADGRYISHMRSEDRWFEQAVDEVINIGRVTGMPVQISHIKLAMKRLWGTAPSVIEKLDAARADGVKITADIYPYTYWQANLMVLLPERDYTDLDAIQKALDQIAPPDGIWLTQFDPDPTLVGKTLTEVAAMRGVDPATAFMQLAKASVTMEERTGQGADSIIGTSMIVPDVQALFLWPHTNVCTDGAFDDLHPRARGTFTRILGRYVREEHLLSLEAAVHKMTELAADHMGFKDHGVIRKGAVADLVLLNPDTVIDRGTPDQPQVLSEGIVSVWVSGQQVFDDGQATGAHPGVIITRQPT